MIPTAHLAIEQRPTLPPNPLQFGVMSGGRVLAFIPYEDVKAALEKFEGMLSVWEGRNTPKP